MKKLLLCLIVLVPFFVGCTNVDTTLTIGTKKDADVSSVLVYQGDLSSKTDSYANLINAVYDKFLDDSYVVTTTSGDKISKINANKKIVQFDRNDIDLSSLGFRSNNPDGKFIDIKKNFLVTSYNVDFYFDYAKVKKEVLDKKQELVASKSQIQTKPEYYNKYGVESDEQTEARQDFVSNLDYDTLALSVSEDSKTKTSDNKKKVDNTVSGTFSIKLPSYAFYNNADSSDGFTYTWNIKDDGATQIKLQYVEYSAYSIFFIIFTGIILLSYLAYRIFRHDSRKRIEKKEI